MLLHPPGLWPAPQGGGEAHRAHTSTAPWMAQLLSVLWAVGQHCLEPGNPSALQLCLLRALCKASRDTQAAQTAALGMAELGLSQATPVAPHVEPPCSLCTAPQPITDTLLASLHGASSALQHLYHRLCLTLLCGHKLP